MTELIVLVAVLAAATAFGIWRRRVDGRMQVVGDSPTSGVSTALPRAVRPLPDEAESAEREAGATEPSSSASREPAGGGGAQAQRADVADASVGGTSPGAGRSAATTDSRADRPGPAADRGSPLVTTGDVGQELGERATLLQFSSAFCTPCRSTRVVLGDVAAMVDGVRHVEVDAEAHPDLVRRLDVIRTPTVFVLDGDGRIRTRAVGAPRKADVIAALGDVI